MPPLAGAKVVELTQIMAGPICGMMLADLGAAVVKVEKLPDGDDVRRFAPPTVDGISAAYLMVNRNKRGIAVDLKSAAGRAVVRRLIDGADVVIENFRQGTMEKFGLGHEELRRAHPELIYCAVSGFGRTGPYAARGGFDLIAQGMSGLMSITGEGAGRPPVKVGAPITDITAGILAAMGVLAAYVRRLKTGEGGLVDTSLFEAGIIQTYWQSAMCLATGESPPPLGSAHPLSAPYQAFPTADGWITLGAANQANWRRLAEVLGAPELADDPRFARNERRMANLAELQQTIEPLFRCRSTAEWLEALERAGVPAGPVYAIGEMLVDPQARAREMVIEVEHPNGRKIGALGLPVKIDGMPPPSARGAPALGQHTREVLAELGYSPAEIARLADEGVIGAP